jgi:hypothetical protein
MSALSDIRTGTIAIVKDGSGKLTLLADADRLDESGALVAPDDYDRCIAAALRKYSKDKPYQVIEDIPGDGTAQYDIVLGWSPEYSHIVSIEYPVGDVPPTVLSDDQYSLISQSGTLRLSFRLGTNDALRITYTAIRSADDVPEIDVGAFCFLTASYCLELLANQFVQSADSTINADVVNYRSKSSEATARAKRLMALYMDAIGLKEGDITPPASSTADFDEKYPGGSERLTHPRWARRKR